MAFFSSVLSLLLYSCRYCYFYLDCNYFITPLRRKTCRNEEFMCAIINNATFPHLHTNYVNAIRTAFIPLQWIDSLFFCPISFSPLALCLSVCLDRTICEAFWTHFFHIISNNIFEESPAISLKLRTVCECTLNAWWKLIKLALAYAHNSWIMKKNTDRKIRANEKTWTIFIDFFL